MAQRDSFAESLQFASGESAKKALLSLKYDWPDKANVAEWDRILERIKKEQATLHMSALTCATSDTAPSNLMDTLRNLEDAINRDARIIFNLMIVSKVKSPDGEHIMEFYCEKCDMFTLPPKFGEHICGKVVAAETPELVYQDGRFFNPNAAK